MLELDDDNVVLLNLLAVLRAILVSVVEVVLLSVELDRSTAHHSLLQHWRY